MNVDQMFEIIRQNGVGQNIECFFSSENESTGKPFMCKIHNYKYHKGILKLYMDQYGFQEHGKILEKFPNCELLIKQKHEETVTSIIIFCKFEKTDKRFIYVRAYNVKYPGNGSTENFRIVANEKRMESS
jgi:hypothetical protein